MPFLMTKTWGDHPSREELAAVNQGTLDPARERAVLAHVLLPPCECCLRALPPSVRILLGLEPLGAELTPEEDAAYDRAIERSFRVALKHARHLQRQKAQTERGIKILEQKGAEGPASLPHGMDDYARFRALLARSWSLRHENPKLMVQLAIHAVQCTERIDARRYSARRVLDFRSEAQAELGNAFRITEQLVKAEFALRRARELFELGTHNQLLEMRILELEASLDADRRCWENAINKLEKVYRYYRGHGENHLAGRALLKQGIYLSNAGDPGKALELLQKSLSLLDLAFDPVLTYAALHNQVWILLDSSRYREAERQLFSLRPLLEHSGGSINELRFRWAEGRIDAGLDRLERAEMTLREVRDGFVAVERPYDAALTSLDLAGVLIAQGKSEAAVEVVSAAYVTFSALRIPREAAAAVLALQIACEVGAATKAKVEEIARFLRRLESDPNAELSG